MDKKTCPRLRYAGFYKIKILKIMDLTQFTSCLKNQYSTTPKLEQETKEEVYRREEEMMIKMGREEHFKEFAKKHQIVEEKPVETIKSVTVAPKPSPKPIRQAAISEYIRPSPTAGRKQYSCSEKARTLAVVEDKDKTFNSFSVFEANKQMQKPKYQTFTDQEKGQTSSAPSSSR